MFDVTISPNDFPAFSIPPPDLFISPESFFNDEEAIGVCDDSLSEEKAAQLRNVGVRV